MSSLSRHERPYDWMADAVRYFLVKKLWAIQSHLLFPLDLHHSGVVNDDLDRPEPNPLQREHDGLLHRPIREGIRFVLFRPEHRFNKYLYCRSYL